MRKFRAGGAVSAAAAIAIFHATTAPTSAAGACQSTTDLKKAIAGIARIPRVGGRQEPLEVIAQRFIVAPAKNGAVPCPDLASRWAKALNAPALPPEPPPTPEFEENAREGILVMDKINPAPSPSPAPPHPAAPLENVLIPDGTYGSSFFVEQIRKGLRDDISAVGTGTVLACWTTTPRGYFGPEIWRGYKQCLRLAQWRAQYAH